MSQTVTNFERVCFDQGPPSRRACQPVPRRKTHPASLAATQEFDESTEDSRGNDQIVTETGSWQITIQAETGSAALASSSSS